MDGSEKVRMFVAGLRQGIRGERGESRERRE
jgi:hypothetical protein